MDQHHVSPIAVSNPQIVSDDIAECVRSYEPKLLAELAPTELIAELKALVLRCELRSPDDARSMLATASRYLSDVYGNSALLVPLSGDSGADLGAGLADAQVARWAHAALRAGMPPTTLANNLARLRRMMRVRRGLPARMAPVGTASTPSVALDECERVRLEDVLLAVGDQRLLGAYVATVGAGLGPAKAVGASLAATGTSPALVSGRRVVAAVEALAVFVDGVVLDSDAWDCLRRLGAEHDVALTAAIATNTHALLALREDASVASIVRTHQITRRQIEGVRQFLDPVEPSEFREMLRG